MFNPRKQIPNIHNRVTTLNDTHNFDFHVSQKHGNIQKIEDDDESGASSPALWKNSPSRSPVHPINYRSLSPNSRTQAIARGQCELMEMVKNMPESCFELSLKDLVEQTKSQKECLINSNREKNQAVMQNRVNIKKKNEQIKKAKMMMRSTSIENGGVFIKMVSPVSLRSKKTKKKNPSTRVSPKPEECENVSSKNLEKEWWKKRFSGSSSSNSTGSSGRNSSRGSSTSSRNNNNNNRKREGLLSSCWSSLCLSEKNKVMTDLDW